MSKKKRTADIMDARKSILFHIDVAKHEASQSLFYARYLGEEMLVAWLSNLLDGLSAARVQAYEEWGVHDGE